MSTWDELDADDLRTASRVFASLEARAGLRGRLAQNLGAQNLGAQTLGAQTLGAQPLGAETLGAETVGAEADAGSRPPSPSELWAFATGGMPRPSPELAAALLRQPRARQDLADMLDRASVANAQRVAAAATSPSATSPAATPQIGEVERFGEGFSLRLLPSRADPAHTYLIIRLDWSERIVSRLLALTGEGETRTLDLEAADQDEIQMLCASDDPILQAIADPEARLWLT